MIVTRFWIPEQPNPAVEEGADTPCANPKCDRLVIECFVACSDHCYQRYKRLLIRNQGDPLWED